jgi:hypothetical protein
VTNEKELAFVKDRPSIPNIRVVEELVGAVPVGGVPVPLWSPILLTTNVLY